MSSITTIHCDRCGTTVTHGEIAKQIAKVYRFIEWQEDPQVPGKKSRKDLDLCVGCYGQLLEFVQTVRYPPPPAAPKKVEP